MENASNALIIAGTILIALIILTIGVFLASSHKSVQESYALSLTAQELESFNSNFLTFENRDNITAQEIVTIKRFAEQFDKKHGTTTTINIIPSVTEALEFIKDSSPDIDDRGNPTYKYYKCTYIKYDPETGRINSITFTKN